MKSLTFFILVLSFLLVNNAFSQDTIVLRAGPEGKYANLWTAHPDNNYGHTALFHTMGWTFWGEPGVIRSLIAFDLSSIPPDAFILNAKLSLYYLNTQPDPNIQPGENSSYLQLITSAWNEETVTWNNPPSTTPEDQVYLPQSTEPEQDYPDIDVTIPIRKIHDEPGNYFGLMLRLINEDPYACMLFASGDYDSTALRPKLEIIYLICDMPVAGFGYASNGLTVNFQDTSRFADHYFWSFGDGFYSDLAEPVRTYDTAGFYQVCLETWNDCGSDSVCQVIFVDYSGLMEAEGSPCSVFPNPARDVVFLKQGTEVFVAVSLLDLGGKEVMRQNLELKKDEIIRLSLDHVDQGIYILRFDSGKSQTFEKLVVLK
jgi:PKD repeat protein